MIARILVSLTLSTTSLLAEDLFNGKDLTGWDGNPKFWRVENSTIVGETTADNTTKANTFLIWKGGELADFELTLKARVTGSNNSGVQYRSRVLDPKTWSVGGYQMDMHPKQEYFAMLYEERGRGIAAKRGQKVVLAAGAKPKEVGKVDMSKELKLSEWNEFKLVARGNHVVHMVNGDVTAEITDEDEAQRALSGILAIQLHAGKPMKLEVKDIVLKRLESEKGE